MKKYSLTLAAMLALAGSAHAADKPRAPQENSKQTKKVWTNEDLDQLRSRGLISIVGPDASQASSQTQAPSSQTNSPVYLSRLHAPAWYAQKAAELQSDLEVRQGALYVQQTAMSLAADGITEPGIAMGRSDAGVTPQAGLANLQAQVNEVQNEIDQLADLARANNIPPGVLRG